MSKSYLIVLLFLPALLISCSTTKKAPLNNTESKYIDSLITEPSVYYWDKPKFELPISTWDLLHQRIHISAFPETQQFAVHTDIILKNKPLEQNKLYLDAIGIFPDSVINLSNNKSLTFDTTATSLLIYLDKRVQRGDTLAVRVIYTIQNPGIGIHIVDAKNEFADEPFQIWTQNQPDEIRYWLPTIAGPADKASMELWLDVPDTLSTIATGILLEKSESKQGRRTDYWRLQQDQSTYLWGFVIGQFEKSVQRYSDKRLEFFTDKKFKAYHSIIYKDVPQMIELMESYTAIPFPFDALRFVPIYEFDSAGMENTGMVTLFDEAQFDSTALIDVNNDGLLMHEIAHHWFGNTVTVNEWGSVALQEGIATWFELEFFKTHRQAAYEDEKWWNMYSYLHESSQYKRPIITPNYDNPNQLFDTHSYEKAALVFDYLRFLIGEDAFQSVLREWLKTPQDQININHFQKIVEEQTGKSWNIFFNQWFKQPGHPKIELSHFSDGNKTIVKLAQVQNLKKEPVFQLRLPLTLFYADSVQETWIQWYSKDTVISVPAELKDIQLNNGFIAPVEIHQHVGLSQLIYRLRNTTDVHTLVNSLLSVQANDKDSILTKELKNLIQNHPSNLVQSIAAEVLTAQYTTDERDYFVHLLQSEKDGRVRIQSIYALAADSAAWIDDVLKKQLQAEKSYFVKAEIIKVGLQRNGDAWISFVKPFAKQTSYQEVLKSAIVQGLQALNSDEAFELQMELASYQSKKSFVYESLFSLSLMESLQQKQQERLNELYKKKVISSDLSIKLLAAKALFAQPSQKPWLLEHLNSLPEQDKIWLLSELIKPALEVEVNQQ
ncbi:hypothetical protein EP331_05605 [bacterium]|nr:MAG: hypothetical protein EP331_05605 [bacterium]